MAGSILADIGSLGQGVIQGRSAYQDFQDRAAIVQQHQMALDQAKRQLAADAAAFSNLGPQGPGMTPPGPMAGPQGPSAGPALAPATGQPPMPGQPSMPSHPAAGVMQASPMPGTLPQAPQGGPSAAPGPAPASPAAPSGGDGMMPQNPEDQAYGLIMRVASDIKRRNPNIDGPTLALATDRIMGLIAPQLRQQTQILTTQMREQGANQRQDIRADVSRENTDKRVGAIERGQDLMLQRVREQSAAIAARTQSTQDRIDARWRSGQGNKTRLAAQSNRAREISTEVTNATRQLNTLTQALVPADDPRYKVATDRLSAAQRKLDILDKSLQQDGGPLGSVGDQINQSAPAASGAVDFSQLPK